MLLFDVTHTSHSRAQTGIQKVVRSMHAAVSARTPVLPVCFDPHQSAWRSLAGWEKQILEDGKGRGSAHRSARWPLRVKLAGYLRVAFRARSKCPAGEGLVVPELFSPKIAHAYPALFQHVSGPRVAFFHDAVALKYPELTPSKTVSRTPGYLRELLMFDGIAAVSEDSRQCLIDYWKWAGVSNPPRVRAIANAIDAPKQVESHPVPVPAQGGPVVLSVGSIEGRKNHLALLEACEQLWSAGANFRLHLIGLAHPQTGRAALERLNALRSAGRPIDYAGPVDDEQLTAAYRNCSFTVYPSLFEGFGLPVYESLSHGRPCICSANGALGEAGRDGGCQLLESVDAPSLRGALARWLNNPAEVATAAQHARARTFRDWQTHAGELLSWLDELRGVHARRRANPDRDS